MPPAISVENLSKAYRIGLKEEIPDTFFQAATGWMKRPLSNLRRLRRLNTFSSNCNGRDEEDIIWALKDVSFEVEEGEVVGIIGRNGAGKSTLLKVLSRITEPTAGCARIRGRVSSLLEVGTGFHPELSGRENIYMNGTILGMTKREIDRKFDEIVDFSGVEKFLDTPIKRYSSGMQVRLAFSVAAHLEPEILIIDEVLAVGDAEFQKRCLGKMQDVAGSGRTVLFVSHNMAAVDGLCTHGCIMQDGRLVSEGRIGGIISEYIQESKPLAADVDLHNHPGRHSEFAAVARRIRLMDEHDRPAQQIPLGGNSVIEVQLEEQQHLGSRIDIGVRVFGPRGDRILTLHSMYQAVSLSSFASPKISTMRCEVKNWRLAPGAYSISIVVLRNGRRVDYIEECIRFEIVARDVNGTGKLPPAKAGMFIPEAVWTVA